MAEALPTATIKTRVYEAMFMLTQQQAAQLGDALEFIFDVIKRAPAEVIAVRKWDERRLAYEIDKQKRACYILAYIRCEGSAVAAIEREINLTERILRLLIVSADHLTDEEVSSQDDRDALMAEARMRAERGAEEEQKSSGVRLGAPEPEAAPESAEGETPVAEGESADGASSEAKPAEAGASEPTSLETTATDEKPAEG